MSAHDDASRGAAPTRRNFLTAAALGGAAIVGASALGALDADAVFAAPTPSLDPGVQTSAFAEGRITARHGSMLTVAGSDGRTHKVQVTDASSVWKLTPTDANAIAVGDGMYARGVRMPDGSIAADAVWLNIVNLVGRVTSVGRDSIHFDHNGHTVHGRVVRGTTVASYHGTTPTNDLSRVAIGRTVQVLGAWRPSDDSVDIARVRTGG